jgi:MFS transporter, DHA1 family, inner membrane transport protein
VSPAADRPEAVASVVALAAVISAMLLIAPVVVGALITRYGFTPQQAGLTISVELGAMSLAALPSLIWLPSAPWRWIIVAALLTMIAGNLLCAFVGSFAALAALRTLTGFAGGSIMVICLRLIATSRETERNFGWWTVGQLVLGAAGLAVLPRLIPQIGLRGLFFGLAGCLALCLVATRWIPERDAGRNPGVAGSRGTLGGTALLSLGAILVFYVALSGLWTYVERIGAAAGLSPARIGDNLTIASLCGVAGCGTAAFLGGTLGRKTPLLGGYMLMLVSILCFAGSPSPLRYILAACGFKYAWTFALPYILASASDLDRDGRLMALSNLVIGCGLAIGPAIIAAMLDERLDYGVSITTAVVGVVLSLLLLMLSLRKSRVSAN